MSLRDRQQSEAAQAYLKSHDEPDIALHGQSTREVHAALAGIRTAFE